MRSVENGIRPESEYYQYAPSRLAKSHWLYPLCAGDFRYEPGYSLSRVSYDSYLAEVILSGDLTVESMGRRYAARAGDVVFLDCHQPHRYASDNGWHALWLHLDGPPAPGYASLIFQRNSCVFRSQHREKVEQELRQLLELFARATPLSEADLALRLTRILTWLSGPAAPADPLTAERGVDRAVAAVNRAIGREPSVQEMARMAALSEYHFIRQFTRRVGMTPRQYVISARMNHAQYLLTSTDLPIAAIAHQVGYASESMFCAAFKRIHRITPTGYRMGQEGIK